LALLVASRIARKLKACCIAFAVITLSTNGLAVTLTHFVPNASGGFDAFVYPESTDGAPSHVGGIFTLPQVVNPGYVVILDNPASLPTNTAAWDDVIHFFDNGTGTVTAMQLLAGGPNQSSYFPSLDTVMSDPHAFIVKSGTSTMTTFTDYSVLGSRRKEIRNYHFFTAAFSLPDAGSTVVLLGFALTALILFAKNDRVISARKASE